MLLLLYKYSCLGLHPARLEYKKILHSSKSSLSACLLPSQASNCWKTMNCLLFVLALQVLYWTDDPKESTAGKVRVSGNVTAKNITGLRANTVYFATVRAYNTAGTGPSSTPVNVTTKKSREYWVGHNKYPKIPAGTGTFQLTETHGSQTLQQQRKGNPKFLHKSDCKICDWEVSSCPKSVPTRKDFCFPWNSSPFAVRGFQRCRVKNGKMSHRSNKRFWWGVWSF